jgi:trehalose 6-phosphate synthase
MLPGRVALCVLGRVEAAMSAASELLVVSNRGPVSYTREADGTLTAKRGGGGMVVTLAPGVLRDEALWLSAAANGDDEEGARGSGAGGFLTHPVPVEPDEYRAYYDVISNGSLWFCLHGLWDLPRRPRFDRYWWSAWQSFRTVNEKFAAAAAETAAPGATVLVQDYQLALVPRMLAETRPDLRTVVFVHTPWCSPQELSVLPDEVAREVLSGLAGGGSCGFHSARWARAFRECCSEFLGREANTFTSPASTDLDDLNAVAASDECNAALGRLEEATAGRKLIVRVDRIELSKNVLRGFWAFDELLETRPDLRGEVTFAAMVYPSRLGLAEYQAYGQEVQSLAARLNEKWARGGWTPVLVDPEDDHPTSVAALRRYDVLLVNPVRDGLNLVAKEGPAVNERDGSLVLSRQAGVWDELGAHAIGVNPFDVTGTASALASGLDMGRPERGERAAGLKKAIGARSPLDWFDDLLAHADTPA